MRALVAALLAAFVVTSSPAYAAVPSPPRFVLVTIDGTTITDWTRRALPGINAVLRRSAVGLLSTRTATRTTTVEEAQVEGYRALGSGAFSGAGDPMALGHALRRAGITSSVIAGSAPAQTLSPDAVLAADDERLRREIRAALESSRVVIVQLRGPLALADRSYAWLSGQLTSDDRLILMSVAPPRERLERSSFLAAIAMTGRTGLLTSTTTRRDGVVTLADIAPTILDAFDVPIPDSMSGHVMRAKSDGAPVASVFRLERAFIHAARVRKPLMKTAVFTLSGLVVIGALLASRAPRRVVGAIHAVVFALPLAIFLEPLYRTSSLAASIGAVLAVGLLAGLIVARLVGERAVGWLSAATLIAILGDIVFGGALAGRSPLSYAIAEGARFHGMGNDAMGLVIVTATVLATLRLDRETTSRPDLPPIVFLVVVLALMAGPGLGNKFGAVPAAVPAFGLVALFALRSRLRVESIVAIAVFTVLAVGLVVIVDLLRSGSHITNLFGSEAGEIIGRKLRAAGRLFAFSYWVAGIAICAAAVAIVIGRPASTTRAILERRPGIRRGVVACAAGAVAAMLTNDAGVTAAFWITALASAFMIASLGSPSERGADDVVRPAMAQGDLR